MNRLAQLQKITNLYALVERHHYLPGTSRHEDDASHSLSVAVICWHYYHKLGLKHLSEVKIFKYALVHDFAEVYAGDVATYADTALRQRKEINENRAVRQLITELSGEDDLVDHIRGYHDMVDEEARFVWICDKIQAYIQGSLDDWRAYLEYPVTKDMFIDKLREQQQKAPKCMQGEFKRLSDIWLKSYLDVLQ